MARSTTLESISATHFAKLVAAPDTIHEIEHTDTSSTFFQGLLSWCLVDDAWANGETDVVARSVWGAMVVDTTRLEDGSFHAVEPAAVAEVADAIGAVDADAIVTKVRDADLWALIEEQELDSLELFLVDGVDVPVEIERDLGALVEFWRGAAQRGDGVVIYTS